MAGLINNPNKQPSIQKTQAELKEILTKQKPLHEKNEFIMDSNKKREQDCLPAIAYIRITLREKK